MDPLTVAATLKSIRTIGRYVLKAAIEAGLEDQAAYHLRLAVDEIATNAVIHGYQAAGYEGDLVVLAHIDEARLTIILEDSSPAFDPLCVPPPADLEWQPPDRPAGGLGILLALQGIDEFQHQWLNNRNRNTFVQFIQQ